MTFDQEVGDVRGHMITGWIHLLDVNWEKFSSFVSHDDVDNSLKDGCIRSRGTRHCTHGLKDGDCLVKALSNAAVCINEAKCAPVSSTDVSSWSSWKTFSIAGRSTGSMAPYVSRS